MLTGNRLLRECIAEVIGTFLLVFFGTAVLVFLIFALTDARNGNRPDGTLFAPFIGLTITILICVLGSSDAGRIQPRARLWATRAGLYGGLGIHRYSRAARRVLYGVHPLADLGWADRRRLV